MSYFAKFYLTGPDAQKAVDWIFTNNMAKPPGTKMYSVHNCGYWYMDVCINYLTHTLLVPHTH